jgi:copper chaperone NosL
VVAVVTAVSACGSGPPAPASLDTKNDACAHCRMQVLDARFAGQLVAPQEEPKFFDDIGCLRDYLKAAESLPSGSVAYVGDHRTGQWVRAATAVYVRDDRIETPMSSHVIAFADAASRDGDPTAAGATQLSPTEVFGASLPPGGQP